MEANLVRSVGIAVGAAALAGSLAVATLNRDPQPPPEASAPEIAGPLTPSDAAPAAEETGAVFETAGADDVAPPASVSFLVRFQGSGPLGRAQRLAAQGSEADASRAVQAALANQNALRGLCFDRFTVGGAEMVLRLCEAPPQTERAQTTARWLARLRDMSAVAYAEPNAVAVPSRTP